MFERNTYTSTHIFKSITKVKSLALKHFAPHLSSPYIDHLSDSEVL